MTARTFAARLWPWLAAASTGVLLALCFPRYNQAWLCWIALTPLLCALWFSGDGGKRPWLKNAGLGFCAGVVFFCIVFFWLTTVTDLMSPRILGALAWFGLMCYLALYFALWGWFTGSVAFRAKTGTPKLASSRHNLWLGMICAAAWVGQEWLRGVVFSGFGWNNLGVALHDTIPLIQVCDITGAAGLSFLLALANVIAVVTVRRFMLEAENHKLRPHFDFMLTVALLVVVLFYGYARVLLRKPEPIIPLRVAAIQGNIPETEKFDEAFADMIVKRYTELTGAAMITPPEQRPQLLIWPEAATPGGMYQDDDDHNFVMDTAEKIDTNFLLGTLDNDGHFDYNIAVLIPSGAAHDDTQVQKHRKLHLVPFGEYIPARHSFPLFAELAGKLVPGDFQPGTEYNVLQTRDPDVKIGPLICFEDTLGNLTRRFVLNGAQVLVNITNDDWFLKSPAAEQHLDNAVLRAVELRRPLIRCANTGVTCFINPNGNITSALRSKKGDTFIQGFLRGEVNVPVNGQLTFYAKYGDWFSYASLLLAAAVAAVHFIRRRA